MQFLTHAVSNSGGRKDNQDAYEYAAAGKFACWALCDGLGGHGGGEDASRLACHAMLRAFQSNPACSGPALVEYMDAARAAISAGQHENVALSGMRTTAVLLVTDSEVALWAHVGDSRLYCFEQGRLVRQTRDHSVPQAMVDAGQIHPGQIRGHQDRNRLLRSLGGREELRATVEDTPFHPQPGDAFLLCSDGFWECVTEVAMEADLAKAEVPSDWLRFMDLRIRRCAPEDQDNYTAVGVFVVA